VESKHTKFGFDFRPQSPLKRFGFESEQHIGNLKDALAVHMIGLNTVFHLNENGTTIPPFLKKMAGNMC